MRAVARNFISKSQVVEVAAERIIGHSSDRRSDCGVVMIMVEKGMVGIRDLYGFLVGRALP